MSLRDIAIWGPYTPAAYRDQLCRELRRGVARIEGSNIERLCKPCGDWWPADTEFFNVSGDGLHYMCRACFSAYRDQRNEAKRNMQTNFKPSGKARRHRVISIAEARQIAKDAMSTELSGMAYRQIRCVS